MIKRHLDSITSRLLNVQYYSRINENNIESLSRLKIWFIFCNENYRVKQIYLHNIIDKWAQQNSQLSVKFLSRLKKIIRKCHLQLNELEIHNLNLIEERIFSIIRHIKVLNVNFKLQDREFTYVKFTNGELYTLKNNHLRLLLEGNLFMTNRRFIIYNDQNEQVLSISYRQLADIQFHVYGLVLINNKNETVVLRTHDQITLNQTFINLMQKRVKWLAKKLNLKKSLIINELRSKDDY